MCSAQESVSPACVVYLPLPVLLDISLSFWSLLHQLNVTLSSSTLSQLKCFYSPSCLVWHECVLLSSMSTARCRRTVCCCCFVFIYQTAVCHMWRLWARTEQTLSWCSQCVSAAETLTHCLQITCNMSVCLSGCGQQRRSFHFKTIKQRAACICVKILWFNHQYL